MSNHLWSRSRPLQGDTNLKIRALDIEASNLSADFGVILTFGSKIVGQGKQPEVLRIDDYFDGSRDLIKAEKRMLKDITERMLDSDVWLTHFGTHYDLLFIQSRLVYHALPILPPKFPHIDTWKVAKTRLKLHKNRLITIQEFLQLEDSKNAIKQEQWLRALSGHRKSIDYVVEHNRRDVLVLEQAYLKLRPLISDHPAIGVGANGNCKYCGKPKLQKRGYHYTATRKYQRFQCTACGAWSTSTKPLEILKAA